MPFFNPGRSWECTSGLCSDLSASSAPGDSTQRGHLHWFLQHEVPAVCVCVLGAGSKALIAECWGGLSEEGGWCCPRPDTAHSS